MADALRNTVAVILPLLLLYNKYPQTGIGITVGALLVSLTDLPGHRRHKTQNALWNIGVFFVTALLFSICVSQAVWGGAALVVFTFVLALLAAFGARSAATGTMSIALMIFTLGLKPANPLYFSLYILEGCCWYYGISLLQVYLLPFRSLHQALREALLATANVLEAKAMCYDTSIPLEDSYKRTIKLHLNIAQKQENIRQLLLSDRRAIRKQQAELQDLVNASIRIIGLYELVTAMHYDYDAVRQQLNKLGILEHSKKLIQLLAAQARYVGRKWPYQNPESTIVPEFNDHYKQLDTLTEKLAAEEAAVVKGILTNVRAIHDQLNAIQEHKAEDTPAEAIALQDFLTLGGSWQNRLLRHLNWYSPVFRMSLRLSALLLTGYLIITLFSSDQYSYWCLLTIVIVTRPQLAVTWQRNIQRVVGTLVGAGIAFGLIIVIPYTPVLLTIAAFALLGFFVWNRPKYDWSVVCVTVCVVLCLNLYHGALTAILSARVVYTIMGCLLGVAGMYIFPAWVGSRLKELLDRAIKGNRVYLEAVLNSPNQRDIWLTRKIAHERLAQLAEAIGHARPEPHEHNIIALDKLQILNYRINAIITSIFLASRKKDAKPSVDRLDTALRYLSAKDLSYEEQKALQLPEKPALLKGTTLLLYLAAELYHERRTM
nr:FUSC family membrane protein [Mucilaginibacter sp. JRF]